MRRRLLRILAILAPILLVAIQFVPVRRENPPVVEEPAWPDAATRALAVRACYDCHSNETRWPWYSRVAPVSWLLARHVREGREELNFSEWPSGELDDAAKEIEKERMPLPGYLLLHPEARLTPGEKTSLIEAFREMDRD